MKAFINRFSILCVLLAVCIIGQAHADVPDFSPHTQQSVANLPAVKGAKSIAAGTLEGKPVLVTFFASWCPPCLEEFSHLNKLAQKYQGTDLRIIAINVYEAWDENDEKRMQQFLQKTRPEFPAVVGSQSVRTLFGGIDRIPTVYGFDRQGRLGYRFTHKRGSQKTNATFNELDKAAGQLLGLY